MRKNLESNQTGWESVLEGCIDACCQCEDLINSLNPGQYEQTIEGHSAIGAHLRHSLDHYNQLLIGLDSGSINYDLRDRDQRVETDRDFALQEIRKIIEKLGTLAVHNFEDTVYVIQTADSSFRIAEVPSTLGRELMFASSHTIHHLALVRLLAERIDVSLPDHIGVAYSTSAYQKSEAQS